MELRPQDLIVDAYRSAGPHGASACGVRIAHVPSGIVVTIDAFDSAAENRARALEQLRDLLTDWPPSGEG